MPSSVSPIEELLRGVSSGEVSIEDAKTALADFDLTPELLEKAIEHGVFNEVEAGSIVRASIRSSGATFLVTISFAWGLLWTIFWSFTTAYGLIKGWDQQNLSYQLAMAILTIIIMGIVYMRFIMPDLIIVKHRRNKPLRPKDPTTWKEYRI